MQDQVTRLFTVKRVHDGGTFEQSVYFTTYNTVFEIASKLAGGEKISTDFGRLAVYLAQVFWSGVEDATGKKSVSAGPLLQCDWAPLKSDLPGYAADANYDEQGQFQHRIVQRYLMKNDPKSFASEVPVWDEEFHGHIDLIRVHGPNLIEVADFKPNAKNEKKAATQVMRYCHLLSKRTGIPLSNMCATYFDKDNAYTVPFL
jgi:hypothetical protein